MRTDRRKSGLLAGSRPELAAFVVVGLLLAGVMFDLWQRAGQVPRELRYVPPEASAFAITAPLGELWDRAGSFLEPYGQRSRPCGDAGRGDDANFSSPQGPLSQLVHGIDCWLGDRGVALRTRDDLIANGLDPERPAVLATRGPWGNPAVLLFVPISDRGRFEKLLSRGLGDLEVVPYTIAKLQEVAGIESFRINEKDLPGRLHAAADHCGLVLVNRGPPPFDRVGSGLPGAFFPRDGRFDLLTPKGKEKVPPTIAYGLSLKSGSAVSGKALAGDPRPPGWISLGLRTGDRQLEGRALPFGLCLAYLEPGLAVLFSDRRLLAGALADPQGNLEALRKMDSLSRFREKLQPKRGAHLWLYSRQLNTPPLRAAAHWLRFDANRVAAGVWLDPDTLGIAALSRLMEPGDGPRMPPPAVVGPAGVYLALRDPSLSVYVNFLRDNFDESYQDLRDSLGKYGVLVDILEDSSSVAGMDGYVLGAREGVPEIAIAVGMSQREASEAVRRIQEAQRAKRDAAILGRVERLLVERRLSASLTAPRFSADGLAKELRRHKAAVVEVDKTVAKRAQSWHDTQSKPIPEPEWDERVARELSEHPPSMQELLASGLLQDEPRPLWVRLGRGDQGYAHGTRRYLEGDFEADDYCGCVRGMPEGYNGGDGAVPCSCVGGRAYRYLFPPFTDNDLRYRVRESPGKIDADALRNDAYRLVSAYDEQNGRLWLALDLTTLRKALAGGDRERLSGMPAERGGRLALWLDPSWVLDQALLSPDDADQGFARPLVEDLGGYRTVFLGLQVLGGDRGLLLTLELDND